MASQPKAEANMANQKRRKKNKFGSEKAVTAKLCAVCITCCVTMTSTPHGLLLCCCVMNHICEKAMTTVNSVIQAFGSLHGWFMKEKENKIIMSM